MLGVKEIIKHKQPSRDFGSVDGNESELSLRLLTSIKCNNPRKYFDIHLTGQYSCEMRTN